MRVMPAAVALLRMAALVKAGLAESAVRANTRVRCIFCNCERTTARERTSVIRQLLSTSMHNASMPSLTREQRPVLITIARPLHHHLSLLRLLIEVDLHIAFVTCRFSCFARLRALSGSRALCLCGPGCCVAWPARLASRPVPPTASPQDQLVRCAYRSNDSANFRAGRLDRQG